MKESVLIITALLTALISGLFYAYSCSVNTGLGQLPDKEYLLAMQAINKAILNPLFFMSFMGTLLLLPVCTCLYYGSSPRFLLLLSASLVYIIGVFGVTAFGNVPLNDTLAGFDLSSATAAAIRQHRNNFEQPWLFLHGIRTVANVLALLLVLISLSVRSAHH